MRSNRASRRGERQRGAPPGPRRPEIKRAAILDAGAKLFLQQGVEATTVDDIAASAGVAKGTFYHYYPAKTDLLDDLRDGFIRKFLYHVSGCVELISPDKHRDRLTAWVAAAVDVIFTMRAIHDLALHSTGASSDETRKLEKIVAHLACLIATGNDDGAWIVRDPKGAAAAIFCGLHGAVDDALARGLSSSDTAELLDSVFGAFPGER